MAVSAIRYIINYQMNQSEQYSSSAYIRETQRVTIEFRLKYCVVPMSQGTRAYCPQGSYPIWIRLI